MRTLIALLPVAGCAGAMYLCMRMMGGGKGRGAEEPRGRPTTASKDANADVEQLRAEVGRLREDLRQREGEPAT